MINKTRDWLNQVVVNAHIYETYTDAKSVLLLHNTITQIHRC